MSGSGKSSIGELGTEPEAATTRLQQEIWEACTFPQDHSDEPSRLTYKRRGSFCCGATCGGPRGGTICPKRAPASSVAGASAGWSNGFWP